MKDIQNLLTQVSIITKKNTEFLDATGGRFNIFRIAGVNHYENTHSAVLAELLNPKGSHGLKSKFLKAFIDRIELKDKLKDIDCENANVKTEAPTEDGRIDILIRDKKGHIIIIENKIYARDQYKQLKRYNAHGIKISIDKYQILYLTLNGTEASENSVGEINYTKISYARDIIQWLEQCVNLSARFPLVRETINQYINHLKQLTNQDMDKKNQEELVELLSRSSENIESALKISENINQLKEEIVKKMAKYVAEECSVEYIVDKGALGIGFFKNTWKKGTGIWFGVYKSVSTYYSIKTVEARDGKAVPQRRIETLFDKSEDSFNPYGLGIVMEEHWINNNQLFIKMDNHSLADEIIIPKLKKVINYISEHPEIENLLKLSTN